MVIRTFEGRIETPRREIALDLTIPLIGHELGEPLGTSQKTPGKRFGSQSCRSRHTGIEWIHLNTGELMVQVVMTEAQAKLFAAADETVEIVDANGRRLGTVLRPPSDEDVRIARERINQGGPRFTTEDVVAHLRSLEQ